MKHRQGSRRTELVVIIMGLAIGLSACGEDPERTVEARADRSSAALVQLGPKVVFTFDVSSRALYERTRPLLERHGVSGVVYAETAQMNSGESWVMSWDQLRALQNVHGWEVASHTINHPYLTRVSPDQLERELKDSLDDLVGQGLRIDSFATPYGDYDLNVLAAIAKYYASHRAAWGGPNTWPSAFDEYRIRCYELANTVTVDQAKQWIDDAIANNQILVFLNHEIVSENPSTYEYREEDLDQILAYVTSRPVEVTTITDALRYGSGANLVENPSFTNVSGGWATGWRRSDSANVALDTSGHGNVSGSANSVRLVGGDDRRQLISAAIRVNASAEYVLRIYHNVQDRTAGGWAVWVDEFGTNGAWQTGQWLGGSYVDYVGYRYLTYRPSSGAIASVGIAVYTEANSRMTLYIDDISLKRVN